METGRKRQHIIMRGREQEDEVKGSEAEIRGTLHATIPEVHLPPNCSLPSCAAFEIRNRKQHATQGRINKTNSSGEVMLCFLMSLKINNVRSCNLIWLQDDFICEECGIHIVCILSGKVSQFTRVHPIHIWMPQI